MGRIHGKHGEIWMDPAGGATPTYSKLSDLNSYTLSLSTDKVEVTCFNDTNKQRVTGLPDFSGDLSGFWNSLTSPAIFDAILAGVPVWLKLVPSSLEPTFFFSGKAYIDGGLEVSATGAATFSGSWVAADNWTQAP
jgi:hypothetical protein